MFVCCRRCDFDRSMMLLLLILTYSPHHFITTLIIIAIIIIIIVIVIAILPFHRHSFPGRVMSNHVTLTCLLSQFTNISTKKVISRSVSVVIGVTIGYHSALSLTTTTSQTSITRVFYNFVFISIKRTVPDISSTHSTFAGVYRRLPLV